MTRYIATNRFTGHVSADVTADTVEAVAAALTPPGRATHRIVDQSEPAGWNVYVVDADFVPSNDEWAMRGHWPVCGIVAEPPSNDELEALS